MKASKKTSDKTISNLENQKVDGDKIAGGKRLNYKLAPELEKERKGFTDERYGAGGKPTKEIPTKPTQE